MTKQELISHIDSVCRALGVYVGAHWHILWDGKVWSIVGENTGFHYGLSSVRNNNSPTYSDLDSVVRDFVFCDRPTRLRSGLDWW